MTATIKKYLLVLAMGEPIENKFHLALNLGIWYCIVCLLHTLVLR